MINCLVEDTTHIYIENKDEIIPPEVNQASFIFDNRFECDFNFDTIEYIQFEKVKMEKIPKGLGDVFKNIKVLYIFETNLKSITKEDLEQFPKLNELAVNNNPLENLPGDLFEFNKDIIVINFFGNKIKFIGAKLLDDLPKIEYIDFRENVTIDVCFRIEDGDIQCLKEIFLRDCQPSRLFPKLNEELANFLKIEEFKDFTIKVNDVNFKVHKLVFMARSATFAEMIKNNPDADELQMTDISTEVFENIINFVYNDKLPKDAQKTREIYSAAGMLKIESLKEILADMLINEMENEENLDFLLANFNLGTKFECQRLKLGAFEEIKKHFPGKKLKDELLNQPDDLRKLIAVKKELDKFMEG